MNVFFASVILIAAASVSFTIAKSASVPKWMRTIQIIWVFAMIIELFAERGMI